MSIKSVNQAQTDWTKQKLTEVINTIHATPGRSDVKVGVYASNIALSDPTLYHRNPSNPTYIANFIAWQNDNTYMHSTPPNNISDVVDYHFPDAYTLYGNAGLESDKWWEVATSYNIAEMARVGGGKRARVGNTARIGVQTP